MHSITVLYNIKSPMSGHEKIIALQPIINHSLWISYIARRL